MDVSTKPLLAVLNARPIGVLAPSAPPTSSAISVIPSVTKPTAVPTSATSGRPTKEDRKREKRAKILESIDMLIADRPSKKIIREYILSRISCLLAERGITVK